MLTRSKRTFLYDVAAAEPRMKAGIYKVPKLLLRIIEYGKYNKTDLASLVSQNLWKTQLTSLDKF